MKKATKILKIVSGSLEALLGIPVLGGTIVIGLAWTPLVLMLVLHIVTVILASKSGVQKGASILGIVTSCVAAIPGVGMVMHIITAVLLLIDGIKQPAEEA